MHTTIINPIARPFQGTEMSSDRKGYQAARVRYASNELWLNSQPPENVSERNQALWAWFDAHGLDGPSDRQLRRLFSSGHVRRTLLT